MNFRLVPLGAIFLAASASAQGVPTMMPDGSILIDGVYYYPNSNPVGPTGPSGSGPIIFPQPTCTFGQTGCTTVSAGGGNDTVEAGSGNSTISGGSGHDVINGQTGGPISGAPAAPASDVPEPASWGMMLLGFAFVGGALRRHRKLAAARST